MENQNPRVRPLWEHSLTTLLGHDPTSDPGIALRPWVHFQGVHNILDLLSWDQDELKTILALQVYSLDDHGQGLLQSASFSLCMAMRILFSTFQFENFVFRVLKCEMVIFDKYHLACVNGTSISSSWCTMYT